MAGRGRGRGGKDEDKGERVADGEELKERKEGINLKGGEKRKRGIIS